MCSKLLSAQFFLWSKLLTLEFLFAVAFRAEQHPTMRSGLPGLHYTRCSPTPEIYSKVAHAGARRADHVRERLLADFGDHRLALSVLAEVRQQQQSTRQSLLAGIEQLIDQVFLHSHRASQKIRREFFGKFWLVEEHPHHGGLIHSGDYGVLQDPGG